MQKRAGDGIRTHDNNVGNVVLYQLSYTRNDCLSPIYKGIYTKSAQDRNLRIIWRAIRHARAVVARH